MRRRRRVLALRRCRVLAIETVRDRRRALARETALRRPSLRRGRAVCVVPSAVRWRVRRAARGRRRPSRAATRVVREPRVHAPCVHAHAWPTRSHSEMAVAWFIIVITTRRVPFAAVDRRRCSRSVVLTGVREEGGLGGALAARADTCAGAPASHAFLLDICGMHARRAQRWFAGNLLFLRHFA